MEHIKGKLEELTFAVLTCRDLDSDVGEYLTVRLKVFQELAKTHKLLDATPIADSRIKVRLDEITAKVLSPEENGKRSDGAVKRTDPDTIISELQALQALIKAWDSMEEIGPKETEAQRKSNKCWDVDPNGLTTWIPLTIKQREALYLLDSGQYDKFLAVGGSGSGKSFVAAYKVIRDTLRHKAPCLIARDKMVDLTQGMLDQIVPAILQRIAKANKQERWEAWSIDGLKFAKLTDKRTKLDFATGGYVRFAGVSARDQSESGSDKILSPSWLHVLLEEISEMDYEIVEKLITRLRYHVKDTLNVLLLTENPPSINHWSYKRFFEFTREDGTPLPDEEREAMYAIIMNPQDNVENLGEKYIKNLSQMTGSNYERFYLGQFQDTETGEVFKKMEWTTNLPRSMDWERLVVYTDPTPLTGKEYSKWADFKASVLVGLFDKKTYVLDVIPIRGSTMDMLRSIKQLWDASPNQSITQIVMENKQVPSDFDQVLVTFTAMTNWAVPIHKDKRLFHDKKGSIEIFLQPLFESGTIFFNKAFRDTERGRETQVQILKFTRKNNKLIKDDIPDAIMRADTYLKGKMGRSRKRSEAPIRFIVPGFIHHN